MAPRGPPFGRPDDKLRVMREQACRRARTTPDYAALHPGYKSRLQAHSALTPERLTTSAHFSVSAAMKAVSSAGGKKIGTQATLSRRLRTAGSARTALIT